MFDRDVLLLFILIILTFDLWAFVKVLAVLRELRPRWARGFRILQGDCMITGIVAGQSGHFTEVPIPAGSSVQGVPVWSTDDTTLTLTQAADGASVDIAVPADHPVTPFNLTCSGVNLKGAAISSTVSVPVLAPPPPDATGFQIDQTS